MSRWVEPGRQGSGGGADDGAGDLTYRGYVCDDVSAAPGRGGKGGGKDGCPGRWAHFEGLVAIFRGHVHLKPWKDFQVPQEQPYLC